LLAVEPLSVRRENPASAGNPLQLLDSRELPLEILVGPDLLPPGGYQVVPVGVAHAAVSENGAAGVAIKAADEVPPAVTAEARCQPGEPLRQQLARLLRRHHLGSRVIAAHAHKLHAVRWVVLLEIAQREQAACVTGLPRWVVGTDEEICDG